MFYFLLIWFIPALSQHNRYFRCRGFCIVFSAYHQYWQNSLSQKLQDFLIQMYICVMYGYYIISERVDIIHVERNMIPFEMKKL